MRSGATGNRGGCPPGKGWKKYGFGRSYKPPTLPETDFAALKIKTLAQMSEEEIQAIEKKYGVPVQRPTGKK